MTAAGLEALVALLVAAATLLATVWRRGERDGRLAVILEQLTDITKDHENRIRGLEHRK